MSTNHPHYNLDKLDNDLRKLAEDHKLVGPCFIGQGLSESVGSDCYGYYITTKVSIDKLYNGRVVKSKVVYGIARASEVMHGSWVEGDMDCSIDLKTASPSQWITQYGKSWYFCDINGNRYPGMKCHYGWNGAFASRDPSF